LQASLNSSHARGAFGEGFIVALCGRDPTAAEPFSPLRSPDRTFRHIDQFGQAHRFQLKSRLCRFTHSAPLTPIALGDGKRRNPRQSANP
jgi:hypothetical protein